jgi:uncharacterized membrane protein
MTGRFALAYGATLIVFLACDSMWLALMGPALYRPVMGDMLLDGFRPAPAILFYLVYIAGIVHFAVRPSAPRPMTTTLRDALLFGVVAYATYDLTNQATLKNWSTVLTLADLGWGSFVTMIGAAAGRLTYRLS